MIKKLVAKAIAVASSLALAVALVPAVPAAMAAEAYTSAFTATDSSTNTQYSIVLSDFTGVGAIGYYILTVEADLGEVGWVALEGQQMSKGGNLNP